MDDNNNKKFLLGCDLKGDIKVPVTAQTADRVKGVIFPDEYTVDKKCITPVKMQYVGNCWIYAATALVETMLMKSGLTPKNDSAENTFSETHMTYAEFDIRGTSASAVNPVGLTPLVDKAGNHSYGGSRMQAVSYFARKLNSVLEVIDPNFLTQDVNELPMRDNEITQKKFNSFEVKDLILLEDPVTSGDEDYINNIKQCLMNYGPVFIAFDYVSSFFKKITADPKYVNTSSYYMNRNRLPTDDGGGHGVAIVGWDDNFDNFAVAPAKKGAFKAKNSWGASAQDDGYIWLSYENVKFMQAFCISQMRASKPDTPHSVYTHCNFGIEGFYPDVPGESKSVFSDTFTVEEDSEIITAVGLCNLTPCFATVELFVGIVKIATLVDREYLSRPGFHLIDIKEQALGSKNTDFTIKVTYDSVGKIGTYIPLENKSDSMPAWFGNLDLLKVSGSIEVNQKMQKIVDYNSKKKTNYGNVPIFLSVRSESAAAKDISLAYAALTLPAVTAEGLLTNLPAKIKPASASAEVMVEWRIEPYNRSSYDPSYQSPVSLYKAGGNYGVINTSANECKIYLTAVIGSGKYALKKKFSATLPVQTSYSFTVGAVKDANSVDLSGSLPGVSNATVAIACNDMSTTVKTDANGNWSVSNFLLYNPTNGQGWQDSYEKSTITVKITDDNNLVLKSGSQIVSLIKPFEVKDTLITIALVAGAVGLLAGLAYAIYNKCREVDVPEEFRPLLAFGDFGTGIYTPFFMEDASDLKVNLGGTTIETPRPLFSQIGDVSNVTVKLNADFGAGNEDAPEKFAGIALKVAPGKTMKNCSVSGNIKGAKSLGGLFYEGDGVTVQDCSVNLDVTCSGDYGAVAHTITGASSVSNVSVAGNASVNAEKAAGIAVNLSGDVSNCSITLNSSASNKAAGVCCSADGASISDVLVYGNHVVSASSDAACAAGIAAEMTDKAKITNCVVLGKIDAGTAGTAYGIAPGLSDNASAVDKCICVPAFISGKKAYRISLNPSSGCIAYKDIVNTAGSDLISAGEQLKSPAELLSKDIFINSGFDMTKLWGFDDKKCIPYLLSLEKASYRYPFPYPYATQDGKYRFDPNAELALYGAANNQAEQMTWGNLWPKNSFKTDGDPAFEFMLDQDEFYLQMHLMFTAAGEYTMDIISVIDNHNFGNNITVEIISE